MKNCFLVLVFVIPVMVEAQTGDSIFLKKADTAVLETVKLGFAVPDIPAFKALGLDPSNILRPSEIKDLALSFGSFRSEGNFVIPRNLAVEVAPALLVRPWFTLAEYQSSGKLRALTKTRLSFGTSKEETTGVSSLAVGLRTVLVDKGDFRKNQLLLQKLYKLQDDYTANANLAFRNIVMQSGGPLRFDSLYTRPQQDSILNVVQKQVQSQTNQNFDKEYNTLVSQFKKDNWNAARMDFAYSLVLQSPDSLLGNVEINKHLFWLVYATRPWKNNKWGQILFSINDGIYHLNANYYNEFTANFRFYGGVNMIKGFIEAQYQNIDRPANPRLETLYAQVGVEANIFRGIWIHFGTGVLNGLNGNTKSQLLSNLNLYLTIPENFKLRD